MLAAGITIESGNHPSGATVGRSTPEKHFPQQDNGSFPVLVVYCLSQGPLDVTLYRQAGKPATRADRRIPWIETLPSRCACSLLAKPQWEAACRKLLRRRLAGLVSEG